MDIAICQLGYKPGTVSIYLPTILSTNQPISLPIYHFTNLSIYKSIDLSINLPTYRPTNLPIEHIVDLPINLTTYLSIDVAR